LLFGGARARTHVPYSSRRQSDAFHLQNPRLRPPTGSPREASNNIPRSLSLQTRLYFGCGAASPPAIHSSALDLSASAVPLCKRQRFSTSTPPPAHTPLNLPSYEPTILGQLGQLGSLTTSIYARKLARIYTRLLPTRGLRCESARGIPQSRTYIAFAETLLRVVNLLVAVQTTTLIARIRKATSSLQGSRLVSHREVLPWDIIAYLNHLLG
jgi:hypothetical protein